MPPLSPICTIFSPKSVLTSEQQSSMEEGKTNQIISPAIDGAPTNFQKIIAEFVGTYILIFIGCGSILIDGLRSITIVGVAVVWGVVVMAMIYSLGHVSGAHINPAVTVGLAVSRKFPWKQVPTYIATQILGSTLASITLNVLFRKQQVSIHSIVNGYSDPTTALEALIWEFILTFILMFVICGVATDHRAVSELAGAAVGATILFNVIVGGPNSGASMNPARSIGPALVTFKFENLWIYIFAPVLGAVAAAFVYGLIRSPPVLDKTEEPTKGT